MRETENSGEGRVRKQKPGLMPCTDRAGRSSRNLLKLVFLFSLCAFIIVPALSFAQDLQRWFSSTDARRYASIRPAVEDLAKSVSAVGLEEKLLVMRLEEGARKQIQPEALLKALQTDVGSMLSFATALQTRGLFPRNSQKATTMTQQAVLLFRTGMVAEELDAALDASIKKLGKTDPAVGRALSALSVVVIAKKEYQLETIDTIAVAGALISSGWRNSDFVYVLDELAASRKSGVSKEETVKHVLEYVKTAKPASGETSGSGAGGGKSSNPQSGKSNGSGKENGKGKQ